MIWLNLYVDSNLIEASNNDEDVHILVGQNGSGKSTFLNHLAKEHLNSGKNVIAIANTIYDKFKINWVNFHALKASTGKNIARTALKKVVKLLEYSEQNSIFNLINAFNYIKFQPKITLEIKGLNSNYEEILKNTALDSYTDHLLIFKLKNCFRDASNGKKFTIDLEKYHIDKNNDVFILYLLNQETELKKLGVLKSIKIYLHKNDNLIELSSASSGELSLLSTFIYMSAYIDEKTVILIDEPENSLHPKWQIEYVKQILDLFYFFQPKIIIATHSPLIINGALNYSKNINIYKNNKGTFTAIKDKSKNIEEIYDEYFEIVTPQNRYLSDLIITKFNLLSDDKLKIGDFVQLMNHYKLNSYDSKQISALNQVMDLAVENFK